MKALRNQSFFGILGLLTLATFAGCGESGNRVIEQPEQPMSEQFQAEESAVGSGKPTDS